MILYGHPLSGNTHKVRLLLSALGQSYEEQTVDLGSGAQRREDFLALNPRGQVPVLVDGETIVYDAQAILVYLARRYDREGQWLPESASAMAQVIGWLTFAANEIQNGAHLARMHFLLGMPLAIERAQATAQASLSLLDTRLAQRSFLELERPTLADLACFPCVALAPEGKVPLEPYPHVQGWIARMRALPFHVPLRSVEVQL